MFVSNCALIFALLVSVVRIEAASMLSTVNHECKAATDTLSEVSARVWWFAASSGHLWINCATSN